MAQRLSARGTPHRSQFARLVALGGVLAVAASLVAAPTPASAADSTTYLDGITDARDVVAGGGRIFVSGNDRIAVADSRGTLTGSVTGLAGPTGLAVTPDGTRLYAALRDSNEVAEIDTVAGAVTRRIDLTAYPCPVNLSLSGGRLWVGHGCGGWNGGVVGLDVSATASEPVRVAWSMSGPPLVAAAGNTLVVGETGISPADLLVYDVSVTPATPRGVIDGHTYYSGRLSDLVITPDGSTAISAFDSPYTYDAWDTTTLTRVRRYGAEPTFTGYPQAVAVSADGAHLVGGRASGRMPLNGPRIALYDAATTEKTYTADNPAGELVEGALAFSGTDVFAVLQEPYNGPRHYLWRLVGATLPASTLTLAAPSAATALEPLTVTGRLTLADGSTPGQQPLVVTRRLPDGTSTTLAGVTTTVDGTFAVTDTPPVAGAITYGALWDGSSAFRWSTATVTVTVARHASALTLSGPMTGTAGKPLQFSGLLDTGGQALTPGASLAVRRTLSNRNGTVTVALPAVTPAGDGTFGFTDTPSAGGQYTYTVEWAGDFTFLPALASHNVTVRGGLG